MTHSMDLRPSMTAYLRQQVNAFQDGFRHNVALLGPVGSGKSTLAQQAVNPAPRLARSGAPERAGDGPACTIGTADRTGRPALSLAGARHSSARDPEALAEGTGGASTWGGVNRAESRVTPIYCALHQESSREFLKRFVGLALEAYRREIISRSKLGELARLVDLPEDDLDHLVRDLNLDD